MIPTNELQEILSATIECVARVKDNCNVAITLKPGTFLMLMSEFDRINRNAKKVGNLLQASRELNTDIQDLSDVIANCVRQK